MDYLETRISPLNRLQITPEIRCTASLQPADRMPISKPKNFQDRTNSPRHPFAAPAFQRLAVTSLRHKLKDPASPRHNITPAAPRTYPSPTQNLKTSFPNLLETTTSQGRSPSCSSSHVRVLWTSKLLVQFQHFKPSRMQKTPSDAPEIKAPATSRPSVCARGVGCDAILQGSCLASLSGFPPQRNYTRSPRTASPIGL